MLKDIPSGRDGRRPFPGRRPSGRWGRLVGRINSSTGRSIPSRRPPNPGRLPRPRSVSGRGGRLVGRTNPSGLTVAAGCGTPSLLDSLTLISVSSLSSLSLDSLTLISVSSPVQRMNKGFMKSAFTFCTTNCLDELAKWRIHYM